jgi:hypothetical protein
MTENASLSDYLFELRRSAAPARLGAAIGVGVFFIGAGLGLGPRYAGLAGLGVAISGVCAWARLNQIADAQLSERFDAQLPAPGRRLRAVGVVALGAAAVGGLLFLYSIAAPFVLKTTGM